ncbi:MAG: cation-transporting P-type ATPase, partial [Micromonosporaceae bacterium]
MPGPDSTSGKPGPEFTGGVPGPAQPSIVARMFRQLADPLILLLLASAVVTAVLRDVPETVVIVLVVVVNTAIGVAHGVRAATPLQRQLARLGRFL